MVRANVPAERPQTGPERLVLQTFRLKRGLKTGLRDLAARQGRTATSILRELVEQHLQSPGGPAATVTSDPADHAASPPAGPRGLPGGVRR
jgi:hypothetical protein